MSLTDTASETEDEVRVVNERKVELFANFLSGQTFQGFMNVCKQKVGNSKREAQELKISHRVYLGFYDAVRIIARDCATKKIYDSENFECLVKLITFFDSNVNAAPDLGQDLSPFFHAAQDPIELTESTGVHRATLKLLNAHLESYIWTLRGEAKGRGDNSVGFREIAALYKYTIHLHSPKFVLVIKSLFSKLLTPFRPDQISMQFADGDGGLDFAREYRCFLCTQREDRLKVYRSKDLDGHLRKTHRCEWFICSACEKGFSKKDTLQRHSKTCRISHPNQVQGVVQRGRVKDKNRKNYKFPKCSNKEEALRRLQDNCFILSTDEDEGGPPAPPPHEEPPPLPPQQQRQGPEASLFATPSSSAVHVVENQIFDGQELLIIIGDANEGTVQDLFVENVSPPPESPPQLPSSSPSPPLPSPPPQLPSSSPPSPSPSSSSAPPLSPKNVREEELFWYEEEECQQLLQLVNVDEGELNDIIAESEKAAEKLLQESFLDNNDEKTDQDTMVDAPANTTTDSTPSDAKFLLAPAAPPSPPTDAASVVAPPVPADPPFAQVLDPVPLSTAFETGLDNDLKMQLEMVPECIPEAYIPTTPDGQFDFIQNFLDHAMIELEENFKKKADEMVAEKVEKQTQERVEERVKKYQELLEERNQRLHETKEEIANLQTMLRIRENQLIRKEEKLDAVKALASYRKKKLEELQLSYNDCADKGVFRKRFKKFPCKNDSTCDNNTHLKR